MMGNLKGKGKQDEPINPPMRRPRARSQPVRRSHRRRHAARVSAGCSGTGGVSTGREGAARLGRAAWPAGRRSPEPGRRPVAHLGGDLASHPLDLPQPSATGQLLLEALDPELASYLTFHIEVVECPFCKANLDDLKAQTQTATAVTPPGPASTASFSRASTCSVRISG